MRLLRSIRRIALICPFLLALHQSANAGSVEGVVVDAAGEPVSGAQVQIVEGGEGATRTDAAGRFTLSDLPAGTYRLRFATLEATGFESVDVAADGVTTLRKTLVESSAIEREVVGRGAQIGAVNDLVVKRTAGTVKEVVGEKEIGKLEVSDAQGIVSRLPGVTIQGSFAFVRGLGDRYSQTLFNGSTLPSPEPERKEVPLDLFPANLIRRFSLAKTYSADLPGEFAGGSIQIDTVDIPVDAFFKIGVELRGRAGTTYERFRTYEGGRYDSFTFQDETRTLPGQIPSTQVPVGLTPEEQEFAGESFQNNWEIYDDIAPFDHKISLSFGDRWSLSRFSAIGIVGAVNWSNSYETTRDETRIFLDAPPSGLEPAQTENRDNAKFEAELNGLLNITYEINPGNKVGIRNFMTRSVTDQVREVEGVDDFNERDIRERDIVFVDRRLYNAQLFGNHLFVGDWFVKWQTSYSRVERDEPDHKNVKYFRDFGDPEFTLLDGLNGNSRSWLYLTEDSYDGSLDFVIPFNPFGHGKLYANDDDVEPDQRIQFGGSFIDREREFESRTFTYFAGGGSGVDQNGDPIDLTAPPEDIFVNEVIYDDGLELRESTENTDSYDAELGYYAGYALVNFRLLDRLRMNAGVRIEKSVQEVFTTQRLVANPITIEAELDDTDILPGATFTYEAIPEVMQFRLAASQTVNRPTFRELAPVRFQNSEGFRAEGNADLERAVLRNYDLRWEWFPTPKEADLVSISVFYKDIEDPIERTTFAVSEISVDTWRNAEQAEVYGVEFEVRKKLDFLAGIAGLFNDLTVKGNFARIESEVDIALSGLDQQTNDNRPLQGQPLYTANVGLFYDNDESGWAGSAQLNTFGERISRVGTSGVPDEKEQPRLDLVLSLSKKIGDGTLKIKATNVLNDEYKFKTGGFTTRSYKRGAVLGVSYSLSF